MTDLERDWSLIDDTIRYAMDRTDSQSTRDSRWSSSMMPNLLVSRVMSVLEGTYRAIEDAHRLRGKRSREAVSETATLVHYTSVNALISMLNQLNGPRDRLIQPTHAGDSSKSGSGAGSTIRLYDTVHLNDPDEGAYLTRELDLLRDYGWLIPSDRSHAYVASFILDQAGENSSDKIIFWNSYGRRGAGCSISFPFPADDVRRVRYGSDAVASVKDDIRSPLDRLNTYFDRNAVWKSNAVRKTVCGTISDCLWRSIELVSYLYKGEWYQHENEVRMVKLKSELDTGDIEVEIPNEGILPPSVRHYCLDPLLDLNLLLVSGSSIVIGPSVPYGKDVEYAISALIKARGFQGVDVRTSRVRYRGFR